MTGEEYGVTSPDMCVWAPYSPGMYGPAHHNLRAGDALTLVFRNS